MLYKFGKYSLLKIKMLLLDLQWWTFSDVICISFRIQNMLQRAKNTTYEYFSYFQKQIPLFKWTIFWCICNIDFVFLQEWYRGKRLKCTYCKKGGATIGCVGKPCKKAYHLNCGIRNGSHQEFCNSYASYCSDHRPVQKIYLEKDQSILNAQRECGVCSDKIKSINSCESDERRQHLWSPCCRKW